MIRSLLLIPLVAAAACSDAPSTAPSAGNVVDVIDGRALGEPVPAVDLAAWEAHAAIAEATAAARAYWRAGDGLDDEEFRVMDAAEGTYTAAGATQTAVLYHLSSTPRCCPRMGLAIVEGDRLVRSVAFVASVYALRRVPGLAADGRDGLAFVGGFGQGGYNESSVAFARFEGDALDALGSTTIAADGCGALQEGVEAARVTLRPDRSLAVERFTRPTCEEGPWTPAGPEEALELVDPAGSTYVTLPTG